MHPLFPVCYEWPVIRRDARAAGAARRSTRALVHAQHDLTIHRPLKAARTLFCFVRIVAAAPRAPGALVVYRFETRDAKGAPVTTTDFGALYRGVTARTAAIGRGGEGPAEDGRSAGTVGEIPVAATAAHVYTECARIWNPIHTDVDYARAAGLPDIILHGTATLAFPSRLSRKTWMKSVRRVRCRFAGMVPMPSTLTVHASREGERPFRDRNAGGETVIEPGRIG